MENRYAQLQKFHMAQGGQIMRLCHQVLTVIQFIFLCIPPVLWSGCGMVDVDRVMEDELTMTHGRITTPLPEPAYTPVTIPAGHRARDGAMMSASADKAGVELAEVGA